ncbi:hypothetical protein OS493_023354 [Desmophyllum pertusum]|uniref:ETS domain-containing protein n=1 Tax=Desmophyllum pertusum TaxID=174260 RepID=A0A9X0D9J8_9CNID|nr:hypothetical protein OS493_023354 [Desmophyllum pertusum]
MHGGNGPIQLWQLILRLLVSSPSQRLVEWTRERKYEFRILQPAKLATLWGEHKKNPAMNFEKLARGLRYYYGNSILEKVRGKQFTYEFVMDIAAILGYEPVCEIGVCVNERNAELANSGFTPTVVPQEDEVQVPGSVARAGGMWGHEGRCRSIGEGSGGIGEGVGSTGDGFVSTGEGFGRIGEEFVGTGEGYGSIEEGFGSTGRDLGA